MDFIKNAREPFVFKKGFCPYCRRNNLTYEMPKFKYEDEVLWEFRCNDCNSFGTERYILKFEETQMSYPSETLTNEQGFAEAIYETFRAGQIIKDGKKGK